MLKVGTLLLTVCLFASPLLAQEDAKAKEKSEAVIAQLKATLEKAEAALQAGRAAEVRAREEAIVQKQRAEEALKAAELERAKALEARDEAVKQQQRLQAIKAEEAAKAAAIKDAIAREAAAKKSAAETAPKAKQPKAERGKKRKAKFTELEQQVAALKKQVQNLESEVNTLKVQFKTSDEASLDQPFKRSKSVDEILEERRKKAEADEPKRIEPQQKAPPK